MKQTENYQLNQWEKPDRIMMEDFNADNAKIDAAFSNHPSAELIFSGITESDASRVALDVSGVDWSRYWLVVLALDMVQTSSTWLRCDSVGGRLTSVYQTGAGGAAGMAFLPYGGRNIVYIPTFYSGESPLTVFSVGMGASFSACTGKLADAAEFYLDSGVNDTVQAGTAFSLWGVK